LITGPVNVFLSLHSSGTDKSAVALEKIIDEAIATKYKNLIFL
jgi:hypothetical protein